MRDTQQQMHGRKHHIATSFLHPPSRSRIEGPTIRLSSTFLHQALRSTFHEKMVGVLVLTRHGQSEWNKLNLVRIKRIF